MSTAFFAQLVIGGVGVETLADEYLHWALGTARFSSMRRGRVDMGIPRALTVETLQNSGDHAGSNDCSLAVRRNDEVALLRMIHRDRDDGAIFWHNVVRLTAAPDGGTSIEHAIVRTAPRNVQLEPLASSPKVVAELIAAYSRGGVQPRDLYNAKATLRDAAETSDFVRHVLLNRSRGVPILAVTPAARTEEAIVDPDRLATRLRGMVMVAELRTRACTESLTRELVDARLDRQFTCFDGGVRMYMPRLAATHALYQHTLWLRTTLVEREGDFGYRTELLAGLVAARIGEMRMPADLITCIHDFDRQERRRNAERVLNIEPPDPGASMPSLLEFATGQNSALEQALRDATAEIQIYDESNRALVDELAETRRSIAQLESSAQAERMKADALELSLETRQRGSDGLPPELRADLAALLEGEHDVETALRLVARTWPDRVLVLESAYRAAKKSASFNKPGAALDLLITLATGYHDALRRAGDYEARKVFGAHDYSATESETVMNNKAARKRRTFSYKGEGIEMLAHLKIGVKPSVAETLRIHFHWDAEDGKLVVGHCGPHLDFD